MVELKNGHIRKNLTKDGEPQRSSWGTQKKKKKKKDGEVKDFFFFYFFFLLRSPAISLGFTTFG